MNQKKNPLLEGHGARLLHGQQPLHPQPQQPLVMQPKMAAASHMKQPPIAPPAYRPQPVPKVLQTKAAGGQQSHAGHTPRQPVAPPVYRPAVKNIAQPKMAATAQAPKQTQTPPVYRPQPTPRVLQTKSFQPGTTAPVQNRRTTPSGVQPDGHLPARVVQQRPAQAKNPFGPNLAAAQSRKPKPAPAFNGRASGSNDSGQVKKMGQARAPRATPPAAQPSRHTVQPSVRPALSPSRGASQVIQRAVVRVPYSSKFAKHVRQMREGGGVGGCNLATVNYTVKSTGKSWYLTKASEGRHSEKVIYDKLEADHPGDYKVHWLYTELEPCGPEIHNCRSRVATWFPGINIYYSFMYPDADDVSSDDETIAEAVLAKKKRNALKRVKKQEKASRRRKRGVNLLKRLNNQPTLEGVTEGDFRGGITAPYSPSRDDPSLDPGFKF